jgi:urease accessory protein UreE
MMSETTKRIRAAGGKAERLGVDGVELYALCDGYLDMELSRFPDVVRGIGDDLAIADGQDLNDMTVSVNAFLLRHGDRLLLSDGRIVAIEAAPERLLEVHAHDAIELARIAYHIGNRHVPIQIGDGFVRLLPDHVLQAMIERLGGHVHEVSVGFQPESGAYGHSHVHHQHDDQGHGGRIHVFDPRHGESA